MVNKGTPQPKKANSSLWLKAILLGLLILLPFGIFAAFANGLPVIAYLLGGLFVISMAGLVWKK